MSPSEATLAEKIEIMEAAAQGKTIRRWSAYNQCWEDDHYPLWNWAEEFYSVKPEYRKAWVVWTPYPSIFIDEYKAKYMADTNGCGITPVSEPEG